ncbi:MAG: DEAD/DEAH box helicase [Pyrinomonadaceae bacterium]
MARNRKRNKTKQKNKRASENNQRNHREKVLNDYRQHERERAIIPPDDLEIEHFLRDIGSPEATQFKPDDFQLEALEAIENFDVLVTAPTGSGKTWIAREEIRRLLETGKRAWYTSPLKALTNSKYTEFCEEFGMENVGVLTGDRKENSRAPLIVGTTEIYRNQLFDALRSGEEVKTDLVILDEAHYLSDNYRGHVWEESIILSPPRIRLLLLSATIGNAVEFADWIGEVRGTSVKIINRVKNRPVELRAGFLAPNGVLFPLFARDGKYNRLINQFGKNERPRSTYRRKRR